MEHGYERKIRRIKDLLEERFGVRRSSDGRKAKAHASRQRLKRVLDRLDRLDRMDTEKLIIRRGGTLPWCDKADAVQAVQAVLDAEFVADRILISSPGKKQGTHVKAEIDSRGARTFVDDRSEFEFPSIFDREFDDGPDLVEREPDPEPVYDEDDRLTERAWAKAKWRQTGPGRKLMARLP